MCKVVKRRFDISVTEPGKTFSKQTELDKTIKYIRGVQITSDKDDLAYFRGTAKIEINKEEFFPGDYETKLLMCGINVPPNQRYWDLGQVPAGSGIVKMEYTDNPDGRTTFAAYRVSLYLLCEIHEDI
jgi:hypothetical protein